MLSGMGDSKNIWVTEFDSDSTKRFYDQFTDLERDDEAVIIPIFINSYGGEVYSLTAMRDLIKSSMKPVATIGIGMAMSCGASLLASGTKGFRFAAPDLSILVHEVSSGNFGKASDIQESARVIKELNRKMFDNLAHDCGKTRKQLDTEIKRRNNADWTLTARMAKKWGMVDEIGIPRMTANRTESILGTMIPFDELVKRGLADIPKKPRG
jgi:ATP-dependent Clp protease protease subunit